MGYNMSYCMFQNTAGALYEAMGHFEEHDNDFEELSNDELKSMRTMFVDMLTEYIPNVFGEEIPDVEDIVASIDRQIDEAKELED